MSKRVFESAGDVGLGGSFGIDDEPLTGHEARRQLLRDRKGREKERQLDRQQKRKSKRNWN